MRTNARQLCGHNHRGEVETAVKLFFGCNSLLDPAERDQLVQLVTENKNALAIADPSADTAAKALMAIGAAVAAEIGCKAIGRGN